MRKDTIIPIAEKHWASLIDNFNQAIASESLVKSMQQYEIIIKKRNEDEVKIRCSSNKFFKIKGDWRYDFTDVNTIILNDYYKIKY